jgi:hypothetical protein
VKNDKPSSSDEFSDFVSQSPNPIAAGQVRSPALQVQPSPHFTPKMQANRLSHASLSPVTTPSAPAFEKRDSWLSSNDISFLDTLGGTGGNMTSKTNNKSKQIGLGIMDLDMFEANTAQSGPRARPTPSAKVYAKDSAPAKPPASQYSMHGALSPELSYSSKSAPSWSNNHMLSRQSQPLANLQGKPKTTAPSGNKNLFDGFNDFGDLTSSIVPAQTIPVAAHPSSPENAKWDIFRSASMSGSLSEWSSSLRSPPAAEHMHPPAMRATTQPPGTVQPFSHADASAPPALDDFGDFTTATGEGGDDFGDFGSPDTTWNNNQTFSSSDGWL